MNLGGLDFKEILGQIAGIAALLFLVLTYFKKDKTSITRTMMISNAFYIAHYFLIGAFSGSYALIVAILRDSYIYLREKHHKKHRHRVVYNNVLVFISIFAIYISLALVNISEPLNTLPFIAGAFYFSFEWFGDKFFVKLASGTASIPWLIYDIVNFSIPGAVTDTLSIIACILGISKDQRKRHPRKKRSKKV